MTTEEKAALMAVLSPFAKIAMRCKDDMGRIGLKEHVSVTCQETPEYCKEMEDAFKKQFPTLDGAGNFSAISAVYTCEDLTNEDFMNLLKVYLELSGDNTL